jgi:hypothetical protein
MISFAMAQELKNAGMFQSTNVNAIYFLNDHLQIRREDALKMWYGDKFKMGMDLDLTREGVYVPSLSELVVACGYPFHLQRTEDRHWRAGKTAEELGESFRNARGSGWSLLASPSIRHIGPVVVPQRP